MFSTLSLFSFIVSSTGKELHLPFLYPSLGNGMYNLLVTSFIAVNRWVNVEVSLVTLNQFLRLASLLSYTSRQSDASSSPHDCVWIFNCPGATYSPGFSNNISEVIAIRRQIITVWSLVLPMAFVIFLDSIYVNFASLQQIHLFHTTTSNATLRTRKFILQPNWFFKFSWAVRLRG